MLNAFYRSIMYEFHNYICLKFLYILSYRNMYIFSFHRFVHSLQM